MSGMFEEPGGHTLPLAGWQPAPEARERILRSCRREMAARFGAERRRRSLRHGALAIAVAVLLVLNAVEERQRSARIGEIIQGRSALVRTAGAPANAITSLRGRARLLAVLLQDPTA